MTDGMPAPPGGYDWGLELDDQNLYVGLYDETGEAKYWYAIFGYRDQPLADLVAKIIEAANVVLAREKPTPPAVIAGRDQLAAALSDALGVRAWIAKKEREDDHIP